LQTKQNRTEDGKQVETRDLQKKTSESGEVRNLKRLQNWCEATDRTETDSELDNTA